MGAVDLDEMIGARVLSIDQILQQLVVLNVPRVALLHAIANAVDLLLEIFEDVVVALRGRNVVEALHPRRTGHADLLGQLEHLVEKVSLVIRELVPFPSSLFL